MAISEPPTNQQKFTEMVRDALGKLYDSLSLQQDRLATLIDPAQTSPLQRGQNLRRLLLTGIHAMRPSSGVPASSPDWRTYRLLELRYIEGLEPHEVMRQLGFARSQYYREQARAVDMVATHLWEKYHQGSTPTDAARQELIRAEAKRLSESGARDASPDTQLLTDLAAIVEPLAHSKGVRADMISMQALHGIGADRVVLRQAILAAISALLNQPGVQRLQVCDLLDDQQRGICLRAWPASEMGTLPDELALCRSLTETLNGTLSLLPVDHALEVLLTWKAGPPQTLLVVDDNAGLIDLFRRYLIGQPWHVAGASNGHEARELIGAAKPDVITLDVMMPREDGWEFLLALKANPETNDIPVIVCSVLDQPQIALTLGASAYLPKPVTQQGLLNALQPWAIQLSCEPE
jgi:CheY-like chemotaxis protein